MTNPAAESAQRPLRVAIIGAGPAGVYAADILTKAERDFEVSIDLFDQYPAPYGLIRYGVAPDHPRIKGIVNALHKVLDRGDIRFLGNVNYGRDLTLTDFRHFYDAIIFATGAIKDAPLNVPGVELEGSFGGADFVSWYDGHPDVPREWPLDAKEVAVIGNGNVALDVARILSKHADDLLTTEIPANVYEGLKKSPVTDVHIFGRRGPAQVKFTPLELRELSHSRDVDIVLYPEDFEFDEGSDEAIRTNNQTKTMVNTLTNWLVEEQDTGASRRLHLHFLHSPVEIYDDAEHPGKVAGMKFERTELDGTGNVRGTGEIVDYPVQAVYRAIGYFGSELPEVGYDERRGVIPNEGGRVINEDGTPVPGIYTTGWIKRGPVGLIGHTKGDALETIGFLLEDRLNLPAASHPDPSSIIELLEERGVPYTTWEGWLKLDAYERSLGASYIHPDPTTGELVRERVKVVDREEMTRISRGE
ncbi:FAD-dependent oxidoreductase [Arthrobacter zhangbolii]|uniref:ferredoxin--NADP(+) reductase n=1 Tax=Arthrobacter zhangbolii TaxID=2886936 RepID=A0A9X1S921_9MICC|nr:FAD-dependent oxidoreductase [Arthrobacter zhangbolii]MCC3272608.1 FAD-dependent oxidoreductase [Arthrobacter zhangbolii]MCC3293912.1 FAD-dependent oxidoreductase [Arthrobacter zhangbolii]UON91546.1 FAD-dependent oxidoreductase [Arthrobacter zhangbolii]